MYKENLTTVSKNLSKIFLDMEADHTISTENIVEGAQIAVQITMLFMELSKICKTSDHYGVDPTLN